MAPDVEENREVPMRKLSKQNSILLPPISEMEVWKKSDSQKKISLSRAVGSRIFKEKHIRKNTLSLFSWREVVGYTMMALAIQFIFGQEYFYENPAAPKLDSNEKMKLLEKRLDEHYSMVRFLTTFIIAGFVTKVVAEWRDQRQQYLDLTGAVRLVAIAMGSSLPTTKNNRKVQILRKQMGRWALLVFELSVMNAQERMETEEARKYLTDINLLHEDEWHRMCPGARHNTVCYWLSLKTKEAFQEKLISEFDVMTIRENIFNLRDKSHDLIAALYRDLPFPYVMITGSLINFSLLLYSVWKGVQWAIYYREADGDVWRDPRIYIEIILLSAFNSLLALFFDISRVLYNPFQSRPGIDVPHVVMSDGLRRFVKQCMGDDLPATMDMDYLLEEEDEFLSEYDVKRSSSFYSESNLQNLSKSSNWALLRASEIGGIKKETQ